MADCLGIQSIIDTYKGMIPDLSGGTGDFTYTIDLTTAVVSAVIEPFAILMGTLTEYLDTLDPKLGPVPALPSIPEIVTPILEAVSGLMNGPSYPLMTLPEKFAAVMTEFLTGLFSPIADIFSFLSGLGGVLPSISGDVILSDIISGVTVSLPSVTVPELSGGGGPDFAQYFTDILIAFFTGIISPIEQILSSLPGLPCSA